MSSRQSAGLTIPTKPIKATLVLEHYILIGELQTSNKAAQLILTSPCAGQVGDITFKLTQVFPRTTKGVG